jgi:DNA-binding NarL/FixJ family response regulator
MPDILIMASSQTRRVWLESSVRAGPGLRLVGVAPTLPFLRSLIEETSADAAIIDIPEGAETNDARGWLTELSELIPLLILTPTPSSFTYSTVLHAEQGALLRSDASTDQLVQTVKSLASGVLVFDPALIPQVETPDELREDLTPREAEVLLLLADGLANREIAQRLSISEHTVKFHIRSILAKLGASSRTEAVSRGLRSGLIDL